MTLCLERVLNIDSEVRALSGLLTIIEAQKSKWPTSLDEDEKASVALSQGERNSPDAAGGTLAMISGKPRAPCSIA